MPKLAVVIVNYNTAGLLRACLASIPDGYRGGEVVIYVVDNGSVDDSLHMLANEFPSVHVTASSHNGGFAYANNIALSRIMALADGPEYTCILNPDTVVVPGAFDVLIEYLSAHPDVGVVGPRLLLPDGTLDRACRRSFPTPEVSMWRMLGVARLFPRSQRFGRYNMTYVDEHQTIDVDAIVGACMVMPTAVLREVGGLDDTYFMYGEDLDWCFRFKQYGWRIVYVADAVVHHIKRAASRQQPVQTIRHFYDAMRIFFRRYYAATTPLPFRWLIEAGITLAEQAALLRNRLRPQRAARGSAL
jgi:N-acetylglucosaminyl-diphospho-decaprenol L-rhamnosyltransferase